MHAAASELRYRGPEWLLWRQYGAVVCVTQKWRESGAAPKARALSVLQRLRTPSPATDKRVSGYKGLSDARSPRKRGGREEAGPQVQRPGADCAAASGLFARMPDLPAAGGSPASAIKSGFVMEMAAMESLTEPDPGVARDAGDRLESRAAETQLECVSIPQFLPSFQGP